MKKLILMLGLLLVSPLVLAANVLTFNTNIVTAAGSVSPTLSWSTAPVATSCTASGGWTGTKAVSGSEVIPTFTVTKTFVLSCTWAGGGSATINWTLPTQNTDGSPLTDLTGFKIYRRIVPATTETLLTNVQSATATSFTDSPLSPGTYFYTMTSYNVAGIESDHTSPGSKVVTAASDTQQIAVTVNPKPNSPGGFIVN